VTMERSLMMTTFPRYIFTTPHDGWICDTDWTTVYEYWDSNTDVNPVQVLRLLDKRDRENRFDYEVIDHSLFDNDYFEIDGYLVLVYSPDPEFDYDFRVPDWESERQMKEFIQGFHHTLPFVCAIRKFWRNGFYFGPQADVDQAWARLRFTTIVDCRSLFG